MGYLYGSDSTIASMCLFVAIFLPLVYGVSTLLSKKRATPPKRVTLPESAAEKGTRTVEKANKGSDSPPIMPPPPPPPPPPVVTPVTHNSPAMSTGRTPSPPVTEPEVYRRPMIPMFTGPFGLNQPGDSSDDGMEDTTRAVHVAVALEAAEEMAGRNTETERAGHNSMLTEPASDQSHANRVLNQFLRVIEASPQSHAEAVRILRRVRRVVTQQYSDANVHAFGSAMNGLGDGTCDVDIDVSYPVPEGRVRSSQQSQKALVAVVDLLQRNGFVVELTALSAKVPVCTLFDVGSQRKIDVTVNNGLPVFNTRLLRYYTKLYPDGLVRKLVLLVKCWSKNRDVNGAKNKHLSSYALTLMVIFYLQVGFPEPLLPSLQALSKELSEGQRTLMQDGRTFDVSMVSAATCLKNWAPPQPVPDLDRLLRGFFDFYVERFDWKNDVISVRLGAYANRADVHFGVKGQEHMGGLCWIEDPIETTRNLNCVLTESTFQVLQSELKLAASVLASPVTTFAQLIPLPAAKPRPKRKSRDDMQYENSWQSEGKKLWSPSDQLDAGKWNPPEQWGWGSDYYEEYGWEEWDYAPSERRERARTWTSGDKGEILKGKGKGKGKGSQTMPSGQPWDQWTLPSLRHPMMPPMMPPVPPQLQNLPATAWSGVPPVMSLPKQTSKSPPITPPPAFIMPPPSEKPKPSDARRTSDPKSTGFGPPEDKRKKAPRDRSDEDSPGGPETSSTFAKVMEQLDLPSEMKVAAPLVEMKAGENTDPEIDAKEVLSAPAELFERRLWEKLYNRALLLGCTHRQALSVTEAILKRGNSVALDILRSKTLMSKEILAFRNSRPSGTPVNANASTPVTFARPFVP